MLSRRHFFGALAGSAAVASAATVTRAKELPDPKGWTLRWSGWREPVNQDVKLGFWTAVPLYKLANPRHDFYVSTTLGFIGPMPELGVIDMTRYDHNAPVSPRDSERKFEAAKAWARKRLIEKLESL